MKASVLTFAVIASLVSILPSKAFAVCAPQCVDYVNQNLVANKYKKMTGSAKQFTDKSLNKGISVSSLPSKNSIIVFSGFKIKDGKEISFSGLGHVGWITAVNGDTITFKDANWNLDCAVLSHTAKKDGSWGSVKVDGGLSSYKILGYTTGAK